MIFKLVLFNHLDSMLLSSLSILTFLTFTFNTIFICLNIKCFQVKTQLSDSPTPFSKQQNKFLDYYCMTEKIVKWLLLKFKSCNQQTQCGAIMKLFSYKKY